MGGEQAANVLTTVARDQRRRQGEEVSSFLSSIVSNLFERFYVWPTMLFFIALFVSYCFIYFFNFFIELDNTAEKLEISPGVR